MVLYLALCLCGDMEIHRTFAGSSSEVDNLDDNIGPSPVPVANGGSGFKPPRTGPD